MLLELQHVQRYQRRRCTACTALQWGTCSRNDPAHGRRLRLCHEVLELTTATRLLPLPKRHRDVSCTARGACPSPHKAEKRAEHYGTANLSQREAVVTVGGASSNNMPPRDRSLVSADVFEKQNCYERLCVERTCEEVTLLLLPPSPAQIECAATAEARVSSVRVVRHPCHS